MANYKVSGESLTAVADAIRSRAGTEDALVFPDGFVSAVEELTNASDYFGSIWNKTITEIVCDVEIANIDYSFMSNNNNLTKVDMPNLLAVGQQVFYLCRNLTYINLPRLATMKSSSFNGLHSLTKLYLPSLETSEGYGWCFADNKKLERAYFPKLRNTLGNDFNGCDKLLTLVLGADTVCTLFAENVFSGTAIQAGTGYVYVPRSLVDSYKSATNWSTFASQIRAIEDYPEVLEGWE